MQCSAVVVLWPLWKQFRVLPSDGKAQTQCYREQHCVLPCLVACPIMGPSCLVLLLVLPLVQIKGDINSQWTLWPALNVLQQSYRKPAFSYQPPALSVLSPLMYMQIQFQVGPFWPRKRLAAVWDGFVFCNPHWYKARDRNPSVQDGDEQRPLTVDTEHSAGLS